MVCPDKATNASETLCITKRISRRSCIQMQGNRAANICIRQRIRTATTHVSIIPQCRNEHIIARTTGDAVIPAIAGDRISMIAADNILEVTKRIRTPARRRSRRQIYCYRCRRIHKIYCVRSTNTAVQRIQPRAGIE